MLSRLLGQGSYGLYTLATGIVDMFSVITMFGMDLVVTRQVSLAHSKGDTDGAVAATATALRVVLTSGLLVAIAITGLAPLIAQWLHKPGLVTPLRLLVVMPIAYHAASIFIVATQAKMVMKYEFWARGLFQPILLLALTTLVLRAGGGLWGACLAVATGMTLTALLSGHFYSRELPLGPTLRAAWKNPVDPALVRMGLPVVVLGLVWGIQGSIDSLFLGRYRAAEDVAAYKACVIYVISLGQVRSAFYPVVCAKLPPLLAADDPGPVNAFIQRQTRWVAVIAMPLCVLFAGFGDGLLAVFGPGFVRGAPALAILALGHLFGALALPAYVLLLSGKARYSTLAGASCLVFQLVALPIMVPRFGLVGAALSSALGMVLSQVVQLGYTWKIARVHGFSAGLGKVVVAALSGFVVGRTLFERAPFSLPGRFFGGVGVAAVVYLTVLLALGLSEDEKATVKAANERVRELLSRAFKR